MGRNRNSVKCPDGSGGWVLVYLQSFVQFCKCAVQGMEWDASGSLLRTSSVERKELKSLSVRTLGACRREVSPGSGTMKWHLCNCRTLIDAINAGLRRSWRFPFSIRGERALIPIHSVGEVASPIQHKRRLRLALDAISAPFSFGDFRSSFSFFGPLQASVQSLNIQGPRQQWEMRSPFSYS